MGQASQRGGEEENGATRHRPGPAALLGRAERAREMGQRGGKQSRAGREPRGTGGAGRRPKRKEKDGPREEKEKRATRS